MVGLDRETLPNDLRAISNGYDWIVIDGAPSIAKLCAAAVKTADLVLIPVQPSPYDIWSCADLVDIVKARQEVTDGKPKAAFVVSRAITNTKLSGEAADALLGYELPVFESRTTQKVAYPTTAAQGRTVFDQRNSAACKEMLAIRAEVKEFLNGT